MRPLPSLNHYCGSAPFPSALASNLWIQVKPRGKNFIAVSRNPGVAPMRTEPEHVGSGMEIKPGIIVADINFWRRAVRGSRQAPLFQYSLSAGKKGTRYMSTAGEKDYY